MCIQAQGPLRFAEPIYSPSRNGSESKFSMVQHVRVVAQQGEIAFAHALNLVSEGKVCFPSGNQIRLRSKENRQTRTHPVDPLPTFDSRTIERMSVGISKHGTSKK